MNLNWVRIFVLQIRSSISYEERMMRLIIVYGFWVGVGVAGADQMGRLETGPDKDA